MPFLPEKLHCAQEETGDLLPAHHVGPLIDQDRQVTVALHPLGIRVADDYLRGGAHGQPFVQLLVSAPRHPSYLWREALNMLSLLLQEALRDEEWEVGVDATGSFDPSV